MGIISLHLDECHDLCPNSSVCYHKERKNGQNKNSLTLGIWAKLSSLMQRGHQVYCAVQGGKESDLQSIKFGISTHIPEVFNNFHATISCRSPIIKIWKEEITPLAPNWRVDISVYNDSELIEFKEFSKMFNIFNDETLATSLNLIKTDVGRLHFTVDQNYLCANKDRGFSIIGMIINHNDPLKTLDTCLSSWIINRKCPYQTGYIDIACDGKARKCPFLKEGTNILTIEDGIKLMDDKTPQTCAYTELFGGHK